MKVTSVVSCQLYIHYAHHFSPTKYINSRADGSDSNT